MTDAMPTGNTEKQAAFTTLIDLEAEQALIGIVLCDQKDLQGLQETLQRTDFSEEIHSRIWEVLVSLHSLDRYPDTAEIIRCLGDHDLGSMTTTQYLNHLAHLSSSAPAHRLAMRIKELSVRRAIKKLVGEIGIEVEAGSPTLSNKLQELDELHEQLFGEGHLKNEPDLCLLTGIKSIDPLFREMDRGDVLVIAGRPSMGKTALATTITVNFARSYGHDADLGVTVGGRVAYFALETSERHLVERILCSTIRMRPDLIRGGATPDDRFAQISEEARRLKSLPFQIDDTGGLSLAMIRHRALRIKRCQGLDILVIDNIHLIYPTPSQNRTDELTGITSALKALAKELGVLLIALSQLSRNLEYRESKLPVLNDLRGSGTIEDDADVVLLLHREDMYWKNREPDHGTQEHLAWMEKMEEIHGSADVIVAKNRLGRTRRLRLSFDPEFSLFRDERKMNG